MKIVSPLRVAFFCAFAAACGANHSTPLSSLKEAWNPANNPSEFAVSPTQFANLPTSGMLPDSKYPWSDDYWATKRAGIAYRWQAHYSTPTGTYRDYRYQVLSAADFDESNRGRTELIDRLSPAEKYDLYLSRYDFPLVKKEFLKQQSAVGSNGDVPSWFGICHGWAPATIMEKEPKATVIGINAEGLRIPFYTSDLNALMSKVYADNLTRGVRFVGERCETSSNQIRTDPRGRVISSACRDTNPGTLHLILASYLGNPNPEERRSFVADMTRDVEVWNQAVVGYRVSTARITNYEPGRDPASLHRAPGTAQLVQIKVELYYVSEIAPHKYPQANRRNEYTSSETLEYTLELDSSGTIIGGEWISDERPDFVWGPTVAPTESSILSYRIVKNLLDHSQD